MGDGVALVVDIGRQSVRFGLTGGEAGSAPREVHSFSTSEHSTFTSALVAYLSQVGMQNTRLPSVLAVAGVARGDVINLTGSRWYISLSGVEAVLRAPPHALNVCAANALALTMLPVSAFMQLHGPAPRAVATGGNYVVIDAGTGLGVAALISSGDRIVPVQTEAGHMDFAPRSPDERKFADFCAARGRAVDAELLLSAAGLLLAYEALSGGQKLSRPEDVTRGAGRDPFATATVQMFVEYLGGFAGDLALAYGAWDGIFLTGAISRGLNLRLAHPDFHRRMQSKAAFRRQLAEIPVALVNQGDLELIGAAAAFGNA